ncbi:uncharacterized protein LOC133892421 [Phragmites australis]|uniref:uncharacterized protein LOC133892421 n=1 Tax=Phragmites australis TaxID=29695 RepID=UPI002D781D64|nr:uncharacterized protein LOC133892421 [Phragmites australis]XP_062189177.1 uncharacterized protein LOC133892421 [Phragmites australis]XP_062189186.1 uncharacterized protein LOC133892421 [Phragmites australis]
MERVALRTRAVEELRRLSTVAEHDNRPAEQQYCDHFSIREYVAQLQKKDPILYSLSQIFREQRQHDDHNNLSPLSVAKFRRWNCSNCLDKVENSDHRTTSRTVSMTQDGTNDGCSISFVRTIMPTSVDSRRLFPCTQQSSQGNNAGASTFSKSAQECNSKCNSPSGSKGVLTEVNVDPATKELQGSPNNLDVMANISNDISVDVADFPDVPQMISSKAGIGTKELQVSPDNLDVMANISNDVSVDVTDVPDVPRMISSKAGNGTQSPCSPKPCEVPNEDEDEITQDVQNECNACTVPKLIYGHKGPKSIYGHKASQVRNRGPRQAASKRNAGSNSKKKKNKPVDMAAISDLKFCQRKPKKTRLLSELIDTDKVRGSANAIEVRHASIVVLCENDKGKMLLEVGNDNDTSVSSKKVEEIQSGTIQNKTHLRVDNVDDGSSLMNWLKKTHKKVRTEKKDSGHKNVHSSVISNSTPDIPASKDMHHDFLPSVGDMNQKEVLSISNAKHGNENIQNYNLERNMQKADDLSQTQNVPGNSKQKLLSKGKSTILIKRKVLPTASAQHGGENAENSTVKRNMLKADDLCHMASENTVQRCLTKVSLGKRDIHNVPGLHHQKMPKNKKKRKLEIHEKQTAMDDIPMDIVELLARNQRERQLMTGTDSLENNHTRPKVTADDCAQIAAKHGSIDTSTVFDTNLQKSLASERKKSLQGHASSSTEAASVHPLEELHTQKSLQGHAISSAEAPNGHPSKLQMQKSLQVHAASITEAVNVYPPKLHIPDLLKCTQEQQTHLSMDEDVTIACTSPAFSHHQHIAEVPVQSWSNKGTKKLMWDSFKAASRNSPTSTYGSQFRHCIREVDSASTYVLGASNSYPTHQPVIAAIDHYTNKAVNQVQPRSFPSTVSTMGADKLYDQRIVGQSGLYPNEAMPATHLLRLMDSSTASGFTNYEMPHRNQMEFQTLGSQYVHNQYKASPNTSYGSHLIEKAPLTLQDLSRHQVHQNLHRPLRPHPRVGVLGSLLQQDIANWSESCGTQSGYRLGVSKGITSFDMNRKENYEALNSGMFSARWNALQLGSVSSAANPEYSLPRYGVAQSWTRGDGKMVHPLDKLVRKDICVTNRNPADFTVISDNNEYMINL